MPVRPEIAQQFAAMVRDVKDYSIFMLDTDGAVRTWNDGARVAKGYQAAEIIGHHFSRFYLPEDAAAGKPQRLLEQAIRDGRVEDEGWRVRKDGTRFWADVVITPVRDDDGELQGFIKVTRDLTERRALEQERIRSVKAEEALRLRDEFLAVASHELKTPLTALQLQLETLAMRVGKVDPSLVAKVNAATESGRRLSQLVEALLDVSRLAASRLALTRAPVDLAQLVRNAVERSRHAALLARCEVVVSAPESVEGLWDAARMDQVVTNLLSNAIKYGRDARVEVSVAREEGDAVLAVRDHGPGIDTADLEHIFDRFARASSTRHHGGMGLGLYLAREIVLAHGGAIVAANAQGGGASFTARLPIDALA